MVDLAWDTHAPVRGQAELIEVELVLLSPDADGLSDTSEAPRLFAMEDQLALGMAAGINGWYVGRVTARGKRVFYFYGPTSLDRERVVEETLIDFPEYEWQVRHQYDPGWKVFRELLMPSEEEAHLIRNRRALDELSRKGDELQLPRPITHKLMFRSRADVDIFLKKSGTNQLSKDISQHSEGWILTLTKHGSVVRSELDELAWSYAQVARTCKGQYWGWTSEVVQLG